MQRDFRLVFVGLAIVCAVASDAVAESTARTCRRICKDEIQACIDGGGKRATCRRTVLAECRDTGVTVCLDAGEPEARKAAGAALYPPVVLNAAAKSPNLIGLGWPDSNDAEQGYSVERSMNGTQFVFIAETSANAQAFDDPGRLAGTTYFYRIRAFRV